MSGAAAKAAGLPTETMKKYGAGGNRSAHSAQMSRLENDTETLTHAKVSTETKKLIMQARMAKKMSQKDLATAINEKPQTIQVRLARTAPPTPRRSCMHAQHEAPSTLTMLTSPLTGIRVRQGHPQQPAARQDGEGAGDAPAPAQGQEEVDGGWRRSRMRVSQRTLPEQN